MKFRNLYLIILLITISFTNAGFSQNTIEGYVLYHNQPGKPLPGTGVSLTSLQNGMVIATAITDNLGKYVFTNIPDGSYQLDATTTNLPAGGVTMGDSYLILLHLLGFYQLSAIQQLAADVTGNGQVGWDDYTTIVINWFLYGYPFPAGEWAFTSAIVTTGMKDSTNLGGTSQADVNGSYVPNLLIKNVATVTFTDNPLTNQPSTDIYMSNSTATSGFGLVFDLLPETEITQVTSDLSSFEYLVANGQLRISWISQTGNAIAFDPTVKLFGIEGKNLSLNPAIESHFINEAGEVLKSVTLKQGNTANENSDLAISAVLGSSKDITVRVSSSSSQVVSVSLVDLNGKTVISAQKAVSKGDNTILLSPSASASGIYIVTLKSEANPNLSLSRKLIICN